MDKGTIARTVVLVIALTNQVLTMLQLNPLPFSEEEIYSAATLVLTVSATIVAWFKNNYITAKGKKQKEALQKAELTESK